MQKLLATSGFAVAAGIATLAPTGPAHALGVTLSQAGGVTTVNLTGAWTTFKSGNLTAVTSGPFDLTFTIADRTSPLWVESPSGSGIYVYQYLGTPGAPLYTSLDNPPSNNLLSGSYLPAATAASRLTVNSNGKIDFLIASTINAPPTNCYTNKLIVGATGVDCAPYLNNLTLSIDTGNTTLVPTSTPGTTPSVATLLANVTTGTYNATGSLSSGGSEGLVRFTTAVPSPLPLAGASVAFGFSRRLRRRIAQNRPAAGTQHLN